MPTGIINSRAPELRVPYWINKKGEERSSVRLSDLGAGYKLIYCFQAWCPGCHSRGFPTLAKLVKELDGANIGFAAVQTVFEGEAQNTTEKLAELQTRYQVPVFFGHDTADGDLPSLMKDYQTGGTPWFILIDPTGDVIFNDFNLDANYLIGALNQKAPLHNRL